MATPKLEALPESNVTPPGVVRFARRRNLVILGVPSARLTMKVADAIAGVVVSSSPQALAVQLPVGHLPSGNTSLFSKHPAPALTLPQPKAGLLGFAPKMLPVFLAEAILSGCDFELKQADGSALNFMMAVEEAWEKGAAIPIDLDPFTSLAMLQTGFSAAWVMRRLPFLFTGVAVPADYQLPLPALAEYLLRAMIWDFRGCAALIERHLEPAFAGWPKLAASPLGKQVRRVNKGFLRALREGGDFSDAARKALCNTSADIASEIERDPDLGRDAAIVFFGQTQVETREKALFISGQILKRAPDHLKTLAVVKMEDVDDIVKGLEAPPMTDAQLAALVQPQPNALWHNYGVPLACYAAYRVATIPLRRTPAGRWGFRVMSLGMVATTVGLAMQSVRIGAAIIGDAPD